MKKSLQFKWLLILSTLFLQQGLRAQCPSNMSFENGNLSSWSNTTDSIFPQPANRVYFNPGRNSAVVSYGITDNWLGTINRPTSLAGNRLVRVGNRALRGVADTVFRTYIIDSLSDKITIYSMGVSELAHNFHNVPLNESPGFGYEIYVNGQKLDCLKGAFFTGNLDNPPVWEIGTFRDTATVRKSTGWGEEVLNFACFVGDTVEIRLFTRDCILLGHYAYAYFDVVCGDTTKPVFSQISINDIIQSDTLTVYCVPGATLYLEPQTDICPLFMGNISWTPLNYVVGPSTLDSVVVSVTDSTWIYAEAQFSNYCMTINVIDSIFVRVMNEDPHDNIPRLSRNFCDCKSDTIDLNGIDVNTIYDDNSNTYSLSNGLLITKPCDKFYSDAFWKNGSANASINGSSIGLSSWSSGNNGGAIGVDSIMPGGRVKYVFTVASGKSFYAGINDVHSNHNNDMDHSVRVNGTSLSLYYGTSNQLNLGTYSGTVQVEFEVTSNRRVRVYVNGTLVHTYSSGQRANTPVFPDFSGQSNHNPHITSASVIGPTRNERVFSRLQNPTTFSYYLEFTDRCGFTVTDTIDYIPGFSASVVNDVVQCGLDPLYLTVTSANDFDRISWNSPSASGSFSATGQGRPTSSKNLNYNPAIPDYLQSPLMVEVTATSGRCTSKDTGYITVHEIPQSNAGPDITTTLDTFSIGGSPSGVCNTCSGFNLRWSQGNALSDSLTSNPEVYKDRIGAPFFVLTVTDTSTGCYSFDTVEVFTSLSENNSFMQTSCLGETKAELNWIMLPDKDIVRFGVDYSLDNGNTWINASSVSAGDPQMGAVPVSYRIFVSRPQNRTAIYRWYAVSPNGQKTHMMMLGQLECSEGDVFTLFPNPFNREIEVQIESNTGARSHYTVQVMNQYGQTVREMTVTFTEASLQSSFVIGDLETLNSGIYYLNIRDGDKSLFRTMVVKSK